MTATIVGADSASLAGALAVASRASSAALSSAAVRVHERLVGLVEDRAPLSSAARSLRCRDHPLPARPKPPGARASSSSTRPGPLTAPPDRGPTPARGARASARRALIARAAPGSKARSAHLHDQRARRSRRRAPSKKPRISSARSARFARRSASSRQALSQRRHPSTRPRRKRRAPEEAPAVRRSPRTTRPRRRTATPAEDLVG